MAVPEGGWGSEIDISLNKSCSKWWIQDVPEFWYVWKDWLISPNKWFDWSESSWDIFVDVNTWFSNLVESWKIGVSKVLDKNYWRFLVLKEFDLLKNLWKLIDELESYIVFWNIEEKWYLWVLNEIRSMLWLARIESFDIATLNTNLSLSKIEDVKSLLFIYENRLTFLMTEKWFKSDVFVELVWYETSIKSIFSINI